MHRYVYLNTSISKKDVFQLNYHGTNEILSRKFFIVIKLAHIQSFC